MDTPDLLAKQIDADLSALSDRSVAPLRTARRRWSAALRHRPAEDVFAAALGLFERFGHRWIAYELLLFHPSAITLIGPDNVERLAGTMRSWGDVDQFGVLLAGPAWRACQIDDGTVHAWTSRADPLWRRAALVATVPLNVRSRGGTGDAQRTLAICDRLLHDRHDLVTKAMSWALRGLVVHDQSAVAAFLTAHGEHLAAHVRREVRNKLTTGRKNAPSRTNPSG